MKRAWGEHIWGPLLVSPALLLLLFSVVIPFFVAFGVTFSDQRLLSPEPTRAVGLENYQRLLSVDLVVRDADDGRSLRDHLRSDPDLRGHREMTTVDMGGWTASLVATDPVFWRALFNTFLFVALVVPLQCGTALALAMLVHQKYRGAVVFRALLFSPVVTSMVVVSIIWSYVYAQRGGLLNAWLQGVGVVDGVGPDWLGDPRLALPSLVVMSAWQGAGFQMLIFLAGLQGIDPTLHEAARLDGATAWQRFRHVTLPGLRNTTIFVVISTTIAAFGLFTQVDVMTQGGPQDATATLIFHAVRTGFREQDVAYGSTVAVVFFLLVLTASLLQKAITDGGER